MKLRPTIFLSGVSSEFRSFRDAVEIEVQKKGCFPINQPSFGTDYREIEEILRAKLTEADAVIHLVGFRFGFEPKNRPAGKQRRCYTQMEYDIAREMGKPVYVFLSADADVRDAGEQPEEAEAIALQLSHRQALQNSNNIRYTFRNESELCNLVGGIPLLATADFRVDISRIDKYAPAELIGREAGLALLDDAWLKVRRAESGRPHILTFVALGGEGKTSLVAKWLANLAYQNWPGCDSVFAWSFYSQGTSDQVAASSDLFLKEAIGFFGNEDDKQFAASNAGAYDKGQRLARIVGTRLSLLILDGIEPLQYSPTSPTRSELKDAGLIALLKALAANSDALCIVTTRYSILNLKTFWQTTAPECELRRLSPNAGMRLLKSLGVRGTANEFETLVEEVKGHALTLNLLGSYLRDAHGGDIRRHDLVKLEEADTEEQGGHAFRVMEAYERAFENEGEKGRRALTLAQLFGLFDRPMSTACLGALLKEPLITGLTEPLVGLNEAQHNLAFKRLEDAKLITINRESSGALVSLDAHPLLREYFARQLRAKRRDAWRAGHQRIYEHLCATTPDKSRPTLEDLEPLYQAVAHGCLAELQQSACDEIYYARIHRGSAFYSLDKLGSFASDLGAVACFFTTRWSCVSLALREADQAWMLNLASIQLRSLGRLTEASEPMRGGIEMRVRQKNWKEAARDSSNLSELNLTLGNVADAIRVAMQAISYADRAGNWEMQIFARASHADALHQAGRRADAEACFQEAEQIQAKNQSAYPMLYSAQGFYYCDLLIAPGEYAAWRHVLESGLFSLPSYFADTLRAIHERAAQTLEWSEREEARLSTIALELLTPGRVAFYKEILFEIRLVPGVEDLELIAMLDNAVNTFRRSGMQDQLPRGLLTRAWLRYSMERRVGPDSAKEDLDEAWEIAERGPMRLHMADIHLYRARLFFREEKYPWESPQRDLEAAEKLINECGYHRRDEELADAKRVILGQSA